MGSLHLETTVSNQKMHFNIISIFPEFFDSPLSQGLLKRAIDKDIISFAFINPRDFAQDRHRSVDDRPYGGGPGMVMMVEPLYRALISLKKRGKVVLLSPRGVPFTHKMAKTLAKEKVISIVCGRYEGIDARIEDIFSPLTISIGDFVLNGGEAACICIIEAVSRFIPGFLGKEESAQDESFSSGLLEYPHYSRPEEFMSFKVPEILLSGHHQKIERWRREQSLIDTFLLRPDLIEKTSLSPWEYNFLRNQKVQILGKNLYIGLVHYPVLNSRGETTAVSLTNLDIHDIARISKTYSLGGFFLITPIEDQKLLAKRLLHHWLKGPGKGANPHREEALRLVHIVDSVEDAKEYIQKNTGNPPIVFATSARDEGNMPCIRLKETLEENVVLLLFGTGHGLAPTILKESSGILRPIRAFDHYRHLSVRSAVSIIIDRILGDIW